MLPSAIHEQYVECMLCGGEHACFVLSAFLFKQMDPIISIVYI